MSAQDSSAHDRPDKPFHKAECRCQECREWIAANPVEQSATAEKSEREQLADLCRRATSSRLPIRGELKGTDERQPREKPTKIDQVESWGRHALDVRIDGKWVHFWTDYYPVVEKMDSHLCKHSPLRCSLPTAKC